MAVDPARAVTIVVPPIRIDRRRLEAPLEEIAHDIIGEQLHSAVSVVDNEPFPRAEHACKI